MSPVPQEDVERVAAALLVYCPMGALREGEVENVDAGSVALRAGVSLAHLCRVASSRRLVHLCGVDRISYIKPTTRRRLDKGAVRLVRK